MESATIHSATSGESCITADSPGHTQQRWPSWYCIIDVESQIEILDYWFENVDEKYNQPMSQMQRQTQMHAGADHESLAT